MPKMQTSFAGLVSLLAKNLYTSADVFIRELLQNAHDGCQRLQALEHGFLFHNLKLRCLSQVSPSSNPDRS